MSAWPSSISTRGVSQSPRLSRRSRLHLFESSGTSDQSHPPPPNSRLSLVQTSHPDRCAEHTGPSPLGSHLAFFHLENRFSDSET